MSMTLAPHTVPDYLRSRGLSSVPDPGWTVVQLTGGVSGAVFSAADGRSRFVVKQSLDKLAVTDDWSAPRERILNEASVLTLLRGILPVHSPALLDVDADTLTIAMEHAPEGWVNWKEELLKGTVDVRLAGALGWALGTIHSKTTGEQWQLPPDDGASGFLALRIEPFHLTTAERLPEVASVLRAVAARIKSRTECLVHGDFSPKNILVGAPATNSRPFWIIDDEVGHRGDPVFDLALFLSHLALKQLRDPENAEAFGDASAAFLEGYASTGLPVEAADLSEQIGSLVLSRIVGRSRISYLTEAQQQQALALGRGLLLEPASFDIHRPLVTS